MTIRKSCIINVCASEDNGCWADDYVHVPVGAHLVGMVHVGKQTWVGIGSIVSNTLEITSDFMFGAGAVVVVSNIKRTGVYLGAPA